jgi:exosortase/archaeosortase
MQRIHGQPNHCFISLIFLSHASSSTSRLLVVLSAQAQTSLTELGSVTVPGYGTELLVNGTTAYVFTAVTGAQCLCGRR